MIGQSSRTQVESIVFYPRQTEITFFTEIDKENTKTYSLWKLLLEAVPFGIADIVITVISLSARPYIINSFFNLLQL